MAQWRLQTYSGLSITVEGASDDSTREEAHIAAIVYLIENADTDFWMKNDIDSSERFYAAVLSAVATHYAVDDLEAPREKPVYALLDELIGYLRANGRLGEIIRTDTIGEDSDE